MARVYIVWDVETDKNCHQTKTIERICDSEEKAIKGIQRVVRRINHMVGDIGGFGPEVTYFIDHIPTEDDIRKGDVHYATVGGCIKQLYYDTYWMD